MNENIRLTFIDDKTSEILFPEICEMEPSLDGDIYQFRVRFNFWNLVENGLPIVPENQRWVPVFIAYYDLNLSQLGEPDIYHKAGFYGSDFPEYEKQFIDDDGNEFCREDVFAWAYIPPFEAE